MPITIECRYGDAETMMLGCARRGCSNLQTKTCSVSQDAKASRPVNPGAAGTTRRTPPGSARVIDVVCGAGALSYGFKSAGFQIACGYDIDESCRYPFETNNEAPFVRRDVSSLQAEEVSAEFGAACHRVLIGCAPCQPFSSYSQGRRDSQWQLLEEFARLVVGVEPDVISMENVPQLLTFRSGCVFQAFVAALEQSEYCVRWAVVSCAHFGVPQSRSRLVLIASRHGEPSLPVPTHGQGQSVVRDAIGDMPALEAGAVDPVDSLHRASAMSALNLRRIRASKPGGTWRDWEPGLVTDCHRRATGSSYVGVYGRMEWDRLAPTITTQYYGFGNGRFGHPQQDRAMSLREGAMLQTFPRDYAFTPPGTAVSFKHIGRMIGNAVPVALATAIARSITEHLREMGK